MLRVTHPAELQKLAVLDRLIISPSEKTRETFCLLNFDIIGEEFKFFPFTFVDR